MQCELLLEFGVGV